MITPFMSVNCIEGNALVMHACVCVCFPPGGRCSRVDARRSGPGSVIAVEGGRSRAACCAQITERKRAAAMAQADKAERKLQLARDELAKAEAVLRHATTADALADRFRFDAEGTVTHELKADTWEVCPPHPLSPAL